MKLLPQERINQLRRDNIRLIGDPARETGKEVINKINVLAMSAFGLIAALAWNSAIQAIFDKYFPVDKGGGIEAKLLYAFLVTIIVVIVTLWLGRLSAKKE